MNGIWCGSSETTAYNKEKRLSEAVEHQTRSGGGQIAKMQAEEMAVYT